MKDYIDQMLKLSKNVPEDIQWEDAAHVLADLLRDGNNLTEIQRATLVGIGAMLVRAGYREFQAGNGVRMFLNKLGRTE